MNQEMIDYFETLSAEEIRQQTPGKWLSVMARLISTQGWLLFARLLIPIGAIHFMFLCPRLYH
ncbi:MAG: hypothetical protein M5U34_48510 [Chloroflexi bacterium]|nr:hypothetical protein [Chloroflexota bacterium]